MTAPATPTRGRPRLLPPDQERKRLLDAGLEVLRRSGYERATLDEVLAEAGVSTRAFYRHFATKDELLCAIYRNDADAAVRHLHDAVAAADSPMAAFDAWLDYVLSIAYESKWRRRAAVLGARGTKTAVGYDEEHERAMEGFAQSLAPALSAGIADGTFPSARPEADAHAINALVWAVIRGFAQERLALTREESREQVLRFALPALGYAETRRWRARR